MRQVKSIFLVVALGLSACADHRAELTQNAVTIQTLQNQVNDLKRENKTLSHELDQAKQARIPSGVTAIAVEREDGAHYSPQVRAGEVVDPQAVDGYDKALALYRAGDIDHAIAAFEQFLLSSGEGSEHQRILSHYWLGDAHYAQRQFAQAARHLGLFLKYQPESEKTQSALTKLITALRETGRSQDADILARDGVSAIQ